MGLQKNQLTNKRALWPALALAGILMVASLGLALVTDVSRIRYASLGIFSIVYGIMQTIAAPARAAAHRKWPWWMSFPKILTGSVRVWQITGVLVVGLGLVLVLASTVDQHF